MKDEVVENPASVATKKMVDEDSGRSSWTSRFLRFLLRLLLPQYLCDRTRLSDLAWRMTRLRYDSLPRMGVR
jgi:hypothetical protein